MSKATIPTNEARVGIRIFVKASEIEAVRRVAEAHRRSALVDDDFVLGDLCERVLFAYHAHKTFQKSRKEKS